MTRATAAAAAAALTLALTACAATPAQNNDVVAVVQNEQSRQAVTEAAGEGQPADQALSQASEARDTPTEAPK